MSALQQGARSVSFHSNMMEGCAIIAPQLVDMHRGVQLEHQPIPNMNGMIGVGVDHVNHILSKRSASHKGARSAPHKGARSVSFHSDFMDFCTLVAPKLVVGVQLKHQPIPNMKFLNGITVNHVNQVRVNITSKKPIIQIRYLGALDENDKDQALLMKFNHQGRAFSLENSLKLLL